jgi:hypothetical protein
VDLRGEDLKSKLDNCSDEIIRSIDRYKENYIRLSKEVNKLDSKFKKQKKILTELFEIYERFYIDVKKLRILNKG